MKTDWVIITQVKGEAKEFKSIGFDSEDGAVCFEESGAFKKLTPGATESQDFEDTPEYRYVFFNGPYLEGNFPKTIKFTKRFFKTIEVNRGAFIHIGDVNLPVENGLDRSNLLFSNYNLNHYLSKDCIIPYSHQAEQKLSQNIAIKNLEAVVKCLCEEEKTGSSVIDEMHMKNLAAWDKIHKEIIAAWDDMTQYYSDIRIRKYCELLFRFYISFGILKGLGKNQRKSYADKVHANLGEFLKEHKEYCEEVEITTIKPDIDKSLIDILEKIGRSKSSQDNYNNILNTFCADFDTIRREYIKILGARQ